MSGRSAKRRRRQAAAAAAQRPKRSQNVPSRSVRAGGRSARRRRQLLLSVGAAVAIAAVAIGISLARGGSSGPKFTGLKGKAAVNARFAGIPQQGLALGNPKAPVTIEEYADFQCPACRAFTEETLPTLITRYVRLGKVRLVFRGQSFLDNNFGGSDSQRLLRLALAAARQNHLWQVADLVYLNQGKEGSGWASEPLLRAVARAVRGLDGQRALDERQSGWVNGQMRQAESRFLATPANPAAGGRSTPTFMVKRAGSAARPVFTGDLTSLQATIDPLLR